MLNKTIGKTAFAECPYVSGNFENIKGNSIDVSGDILTAVSLIHGLNAFTGPVSAPIDLTHSDFLSAGFKIVGIT